MNAQLNDKTQSLSEPEKKHFIRSNLGMIVFLGVLVLMIAFFAGWLPIKPVVVATGSMSPAIEIGDVVLVCPTDTDALEVGDIIKYRDGSYSVIHRIVECRESEEGAVGFVTKGDFNNAVDEPIGAEQIEGRVLLTVPKIGKLTIWLRELCSGE